MYVDISLGLRITSSTIVGNAKASKGGGMNREKKGGRGEAKRKNTICIDERFSSLYTFK